VIETKDAVEMIDVLMTTAKKQRESIPYGKDFHPMAFIMAEAMSIIVIEGWKNDKEKHRIIAGVMMKARQDKARALCLVTDARCLKQQAFINYFKIPKGISADLFRNEYHRILKEHGGDMGTLPAEVWEDVMSVMANGPEIPLTIRIATYQCGPEGKIVWGAGEAEKKMTENEWRSHSDLLTDWWS
jgi:hypothetical protein